MSSTNISRKLFAETRHSAFRQTDRCPVVHRAQRQGVRPRARAVRKLKDIIPQQMFEVPIQAAVGGRVLAKSNGTREAKRTFGEVLRRRYLAQA